ncbi:MAG: DUF2306 domain-containing protein [Pseudomonadota bacterium]|nr:DUF2306 domain-containing protein [Pseudomonadota bacterium]
MTQAASRPIPPFDLAPAVRLGLFAAGGALLALAGYAVARAALGLAPPTPWVRDFALLVHLSTVIPAIPLGLFIFLTRKGSARHKLLGKIWLALMGVTAIATLFVRNIQDGGFSWIHIFSVLTLIAIPKAILTARRGQIAEHKAHLLSLFVGALLIAGGASFLPHRTMWLWAFG